MQNEPKITLVFLRECACVCLGVLPKHQSTWGILTSGLIESPGTYFSLAVKSMQKGNNGKRRRNEKARSACFFLAPPRESTLVRSNLVERNVARRS